MSLSHPHTLILGAGGFVGQALYKHLQARGFALTAGLRNPKSFRNKFPGAHCRYVDVEDKHSTQDVMRGIDSLVYLVHHIGEQGDYVDREVESARRVAAAAADMGVKNIVYLGGVQPKNTASPHLRARALTGEILRAGTVPTIELRAAMIVGGGSASAQMLRDLCARMPIVPLPPWAENRCQPVFLDDVLWALAHALDHPLSRSAVFSLPGPEALSVKELLMQSCEALGRKPQSLETPDLSKSVLRPILQQMTSVEASLAVELLESMHQDLLATEPPYWGIENPNYQPKAYLPAFRLFVKQARPPKRRFRVAEHLIRMAEHRH